MVHVAGEEFLGEHGLVFGLELLGEGVDVVVLLGEEFHGVLDAGFELFGDEAEALGGGVELGFGGEVALLGGEGVVADGFEVGEELLAGALVLEAGAFKLEFGAAHVCADLFAVEDREAEVQAEAFAQLVAELVEVGGAGAGVPAGRDAGAHRDRGEGGAFGDLYAQVGGLDAERAAAHLRQGGEGLVIDFQQARERRADHGVVDLGEVDLEVLLVDAQFEDLLEIQASGFKGIFGGDGLVLVAGVLRLELRQFDARDAAGGEELFAALHLALGELLSLARKVEGLAVVEHLQVGLCHRDFDVEGSLFDVQFAGVALDLLLPDGIAELAALVERQAGIQAEIVGERGAARFLHIVVESVDVAEVGAEAAREIERGQLGGAGLFERGFGRLEGHFLGFDLDVVLPGVFDAVAERPGLLGLRGGRRND